MTTVEPALTILGLTRADKMDITALDLNHEVTFEERAAGDGR